MNKMLLACTVICLTFLNTSILYAGDTPKKYRIEQRISYEYLTPNDIYGDRKTAAIDLYCMPKNTFSYFFELAGFTRKEGDALLFVTGAYKDWLSRMYTYSALSFGTNSEYLQKYRIDNDFNIKLGKDKNIVWVLGFSHMKYFNVHKDNLLSTGITYYMNKFVWTYRVFRNCSDPGNVISYSHLFNVGYGIEGWQWTYFVLSTGRQGYMATQTVTLDTVDEDVLNLELKHRRWLKKNYGIFSDISYLKIYDGYEDYGLTIGAFKEF